MIDLPSAFKSAAVTHQLRLRGVSHFSFEASKAASAKLDGGFKRQVAFLGDVALREAGAAGHPYRLLLEQLQKQARWLPQFDVLLNPVFQATAELATKQASLGTTAASALAGARDGSLGLLGALLFLSAAGGSSLGAMNWHLHRGTQESDEQNESMRASIDELRQARNDVAMG